MPKGGGKGKLTLHLFTFEHDVTHSHSFLVASHKGGMTSALKVLNVNEQKDTLRQLRLRIETFKDRGMLRRTLLFSEILQSVALSVNWHNYPRDISLFAYQFAVVPRHWEQGQPPTVVPLEDEVLPLEKVIPLGDPTKLPMLVVVPVSQICPVRQQCHRDVVIDFASPDAPGNQNASKQESSEKLAEEAHLQESKRRQDIRGSLTEEEIDELFAKIREFAVSK